MLFCVLFICFVSHICMQLHRKSIEFGRQLINEMKKYRSWCKQTDNEQETE